MRPAGQVALLGHAGHSYLAICNSPFVICHFFICSFVISSFAIDNFLAYLAIEKMNHPFRL